MNKPLFNFGPPIKKIRKKDEKLNYTQAKKKHGIKPFGDTDRDGYLNISDCKPLNPKKHGVYKKYKDRPVFSYTTPGLTHGKVFERLEDPTRGVPVFQREAGSSGGVWSSILSKGLIAREKMKEKIGETPFKSVVGVHDLVIQKEEAPMTVLGHHHIKRYLQSVHPSKQFFFEAIEPTKVTIIDESGKRSKTSIAKALHKKPEIYDVELQGKPGYTEKVRARHIIKPPWQVEELTKHFGSIKPVKLFITDDPVDVVMKSAQPGKDKEGSGDKFAWVSCETPEGAPEGLSREYSGRDMESDSHEFNIGPIHDVELMSGVGYFYLGDKVPRKDVPSSRISLRWMTESGEWEGKKYIGISPKIYPSGSTWLKYATQELLKKKGVISPTGGITPYKYRGFSDTAFNSEDIQQELRDMGYELGEDEEGDAIETERGGYYGVPKHYVEDSPGQYTHFTMMPDVYRGTVKKPKTKKLSVAESREKLITSEQKVPRAHMFHLSTKSGFKTKVLQREETPPDIASRLAFDPSIRVKEEAAKYPKLSPEATKELVLSAQEQEDVRRNIFINPSLTYKQRRGILGQKEGLFKEVPLSESGPKVSMELYRMGSPTEREYLGTFTKQPQVLLRVLEEGTTKQIFNVLRNDATPEHLIKHYLASNKRDVNTIIDVLQRRNFSEELNGKIYNMYPHNEKLLLTLIEHQTLNASTRKKIESKIFRYESLLRSLARSPESFSTDAIKKAIEVIPESRFSILTDNLAYSYGSLEGKKEIVRALLSRLLKQPKSGEDVMEVFKRARDDELEETLLKTLSSEKMSKNTFKTLLKFLMSSQSRNTRDKLVKKFG